MSDGQIQLVIDLPDHGAGELGQFAQGVLNECREAGPAEEARLFLGLNTMPDPPAPFPGYIRFSAVPGAWAACGGNLTTFLEAAAWSLRSQPPPPGSAFSPDHHRIQALLRQDSIAMSYPAYLVLPGEDPAGRAILDNLAEGYLLPEDLELSPGARPAEPVWALDRAGTRLVLSQPPGTADGTPLVLRADDALGKGAVIFDLLADILDAQYTWIRKVFG
ncbi:hypothetical protein [Actinocorallia aurantiaca]|uniref:Uncharacterized protein n=1 Tax=Actinocorallia aurantiaca TaxID=46204 RepID=A0ABN3U2F9_9ACTN